MDMQNIFSSANTVMEWNGIYQQLYLVGAFYAHTTTQLLCKCALN